MKQSCRILLTLYYVQCRFSLLSLSKVNINCFVKGDFHRDTVSHKLKYIVDLGQTMGGWKTRWGGGGWEFDNNSNNILSIFYFCTWRVFQIIPLLHKPVLDCMGLQIFDLRWPMGSTWCEWEPLFWPLDWVRVGKGTVLAERMGTSRKGHELASLIALCQNGCSPHSPTIKNESDSRNHTL